MYLLLLKRGCRTRGQLTEHFGCSELMLDRALTRLRDAGIITTRKGPAGGICAAGDPRA